MSSRTIEEALPKKAMQRILDFCIRLTDPESIILFGSYAKGTHNVFSDIDILIITQYKLHNRISTERQIKLFIHELGLNSDVLIYDSNQFQKASKDPLSFLGSISKEGLLIYDKTA